MLEKKYIRKMKREYNSYANVRRDVIKHSGDAQHHAKRAIFEIHAGNLKAAEAEKLLKALQKRYRKTQKALKEGSYREGVEEYVEATLLYQFITSGKMGEIKNISVDDSVFLAGLCDVPGELQRYAIKSATIGDRKMVEKCVSAGKEIVGELIEFHFTKYLRTKFDQAKGAVRRLEIISYELSLKE